MSAVIFRIMGLWEKKILKAEVWKKKKKPVTQLKMLSLHENVFLEKWLHLLKNS